MFPEPTDIQNAVRLGMTRPCRPDADEWAVASIDARLDLLVLELPGASNSRHLLLDVDNEWLPCAHLAGRARAGLHRVDRVLLGQESRPG